MDINQVKLTIKLDETGHPASFAPYVLKDSNRMIEEFMLLANMRVAVRISETFPGIPKFHWWSHIEFARFRFVA